MPTSPSPRRGARTPPPAPPPDPSRSLLPRLALIGVVAAVAVVICVLPASIAARFLPPSVRAADFSGSIWHGSAGRLTIAGRPAGAIEWTIHPLALLGRRLSADLHWVKGGFVLDGSAEATAARLHASKLDGGGPLADLTDLGLDAGWKGNAAVHVTELSAELTAGGARLTSAVGDIGVGNVAALQIAGGAPLGGYVLKFDDPDAASGELTATLSDTGGPLELNAQIRLATQARSGLLSGTLKARPEASPQLRAQLDGLAQLHAPDAAGRLPVDLEFTF